MEATPPATDVFLLAASLLTRCFLAGAFVGAVVSLVQIRYGNWHPWRAESFLPWLAFPVYAGLTTGVMVALWHVPPQAQAKPAWLVLCLAGCAVAALIGSAAVARFEGWRNPQPVEQKKRRRGRRAGKSVRNFSRWEEHLLKLMVGAKPPPAEKPTLREPLKPAEPLRLHPMTIPRRTTAGWTHAAALQHASAAHLPEDPVEPKTSRRERRSGQGRLVKPIK